MVAERALVGIGLVLFSALAMVVVLVDECGRSIFGDCFKNIDRENAERKKELRSKVNLAIVSRLVFKEV